MALTATATPCIRTDILHHLKMKSPKWFLSSFNRQNLAYEFQPEIHPKLLCCPSRGLLP
ncbi:Bloom syndrome protein -like protein [Caligus rogercresseyi]|uniref:Bloom syndrome protein -like protein n=1 Tax=Caligus rogercresseyi TaxID=217165 RepID=A0A7T8KLB8_CALRO|nr:Bloom syndrome protein -like protein [Caligus rogercresseyi]